MTGPLSYHRKVLRKQYGKICRESIMVYAERDGIKFYTVRFDFHEHTLAQIIRVITTKKGLIRESRREGYLEWVNYI